MPEPIVRAAVLRPVALIMDTVRKTAQRAARWLLWDRVWPMIEARVAPLEARVGSIEARVGSIEARVGSIEARVGSIEARLDPIEARVSKFERGWRQHAPAFLNAVSTVSALGYELSKTNHDLSHKISRVGERIEARLDPIEARADEFSKTSNNLSDDILRIWERIEFVRREIFFELKYKIDTSATNIPNGGEARVVAQEKLAAAQTAALRINLGCGHIPLEGYINVDRRGLPGVDVVADVGNLPIEPGTVQEMFSAHLVEHFPQEMLRRRLLPYWKSLLVPGGMFRAIVPDGEAMLQGIADRTYPFEDFREVLFGAQEYDGDFHFNLLTPASFTTLLHEAGLTDITVPVKGRRNGKCFEFEIRAIRAPSTSLDCSLSRVNGREQTENAGEPEQKL